LYYLKKMYLLITIFLGILSPRTKNLKTPKLDKCDQYLKCLANPELVYHNNAEDPFLKMYVEA